MDKNNHQHTTNTYRICVSGLLDQHWSIWFDGFTLEYVDGDTILTGSVTDQAALHGILTKIRNLGLTIKLVKLEDAQ